MARIVVELEVEGDAQQANDVARVVVNALLNGSLTVKRALVLDDPLVFHAHSEGDSSVGIGSSGATVEVRGLDADAVTINALRELLEDAFKMLFDDRRARVLTQAQFDALNASGEEA